MSATSLPTVLTNIRTLLVARPALTKVKVFTAPVPPNLAGTESIEMGNEVDISLETQAMGSTKLKEEYDVPCVVSVYRPVKPGSATALEAAIAAARTRCAEIVAEVVATLAGDSTATGAAIDCEMSEQKWLQGYAADSSELGRFCSCQFSFHVQSTVTP